MKILKVLGVVFLACCVLLLAMMIGAMLSRAAIG
jgi:hypothetical protein